MERVMVSRCVIWSYSNLGARSFVLDPCFPVFQARLGERPLRLEEQLARLDDAVPLRWCCCQLFASFERCGSKPGTTSSCLFSGGGVSGKVARSWVAAVAACGAAQGMCPARESMAESLPAMPSPSSLRPARRATTCGCRSVGADAVVSYLMRREVAGRAGGRPRRVPGCCRRFAEDDGQRRVEIGLAIFTSKSLGGGGRVAR